MLLNVSECLRRIRIVFFLCVCMVFCDLIEGPTGATTWPLLLFFFCATIACTKVKRLGNASQAKDKIYIYNIYIILYIYNNHLHNYI